MSGILNVFNLSYLAYSNPLTSSDSALVSYAQSGKAIVGSKFTTAGATAVTNQLLATARTDTIAGYTPSVHGRGEASLSRALAPASIR